MVLPAFIIYLFVMAFPIILSVVISLSNYGGGQMFGGEPWRIVGFQQYGKLIHDPYFWNALKNNVYIVLISVFGQLPLGFTLAYLIYRKIVKFGSFWQGILYVPAIISIIVIGIMWNIIFSPYGPIAEIVNKEYTRAYTAQLSGIFASTGGLAHIDKLVAGIMRISGSTINAVFASPAEELKAFLAGYQPEQLNVLKSDLVNLLAPKWNADFLNMPNVSMLPILFVLLWSWTGVYLILFLANMQKIDVQIIEAASIDGATESQIMRYIILPSLSGVVINMAILCIAGSLNSFALILALTGGGPARVTQVLSIYMYDSAFMGAPDYPLSNTIAVSIVIFSFILIGITKLVGKRTDEEGIRS
jgi:ABC-type sugar transport system permease subunit